MESWICVKVDHSTCGFSQLPLALTWVLCCWWGCKRTWYRDEKYVYADNYNDDDDDDDDDGDGDDDDDDNDNDGTSATVAQPASV